MGDEPLRIQIQNSDPVKKSVKDIYEGVAQELQWILKLNEQQAKIKKSQYDAYVAEGFTDEQAIYLVK